MPSTFKLNPPGTCYLDWNRLTSHQGPLDNVVVALLRIEIVNCTQLLICKWHWLLMKHRSITRSNTHRFNVQLLTIVFHAAHMLLLVNGLALHRLIIKTNHHHIVKVMYLTNWSLVYKYDKLQRRDDKWLFYIL